MKLSSLCVALLALSFGVLHGEDDKKEGVDLGPILFDPELWTKKLTELETKEPEPEESETKLREELKKKGIKLGDGEEGLEWLSSNKDGLRADPKFFELFGKEIGEVVIRATDGLASTVSVSLYNRGDNGEITLNEFNDAFNVWRDHLDDELEVRSEKRDSKGAVNIIGLMWRKGDSAFLLESSINKSGKIPEFIRLRVASLSAAKNKSNKVAKRSTLDDNVSKDEDGFTFVKGVPMVDQGTKGYCVVASIERVGRYYGLEVDQHELAQVAKTGGDSGTSGEDMEKAFQKITGRIHVRTLKLVDYDERDFKKDLRGYNRAAKKAGVKTFDTDKFYIGVGQFWTQLHPETYREMKADQNGFDFFNSKIKTYVDQGIPLCWTLYLGMFKEGDLPQSRGGHMRLITGYRQDPGQDAMILYTDSWGEGHERKTMRADEAFCMTMGLYAMVPNK